MCESQLVTVTPATGLPVGPGGEDFVMNLPAPLIPTSYDPSGGTLSLVTLVFSEIVVAATGTSAQVVLADCGSDMVCDSDTDVVINYFDVGGDSLKFTGTNIVYVNAGVLPPFKRYKMTVPAAAFAP